MLTPSRARDGSFNSARQTAENKVQLSSAMPCINLAGMSVLQKGINGGHLLALSVPKSINTQPGPRNSVFFPIFISFTSSTPSNQNTHILIQLR